MKMLRGNTTKTKALPSGAKQFMVEVIEEVTVTRTWTKIFTAVNEWDAEKQAHAELYDHDDLEREEWEEEDEDENWDYEVGAVKLVNDSEE